MTKRRTTRQLLAIIPNVPCLYRHKINGNYYGIKKINGKEKDHSLDTRDRKEAERNLKDWIEQLGKLDAEAQKTTLDQLLQKFEKIRLGKSKSTRDTEASVIKKLKSSWKHGLDIRVADIKPSMLDEWLAEHEQELMNSSYTGTALWQPLRGSLFGVSSYSSAMNTIHTHFRISHALAALLLTIGLAALAPLATAAEGEFSKPVIDIGMVVKDSERTAQFLTNVVGFKEVRGFSVNAEVARKIGLIDGYPVEVRVFLLEGTEPATRLKVLSFPKAQGKQADQAFIHSTLGFRYLTLYVTDVNQILARLKKTGVPTLGETPMEMGTGTWLVAIKDPDGNFIEFVGPRK